METALLMIFGGFVAEFLVFLVALAVESRYAKSDGSRTWSRVLIGLTAVLGASALAAPAAWIWQSPSSISELGLILDTVVVLAIAMPIALWRRLRQRQIEGMGKR